MGGRIPPDMPSDESYYELDADPALQKHIRIEREKARKLRKAQWWFTLKNKGICYYCGQQFLPDQLSMDHIVPLARGGKSTKGNIVPACVDCNRKKKLETPAETAIRKLRG